MENEFGLASCESNRVPEIIARYISYDIRTGKDLRNDALEKFLPFLENIFKKVNSTDEKYEAKLSMHDLLYKMKVLAILDPATIEKFLSGQDTAIRFQLHWATLQVEGNIFLNKESKSMANCSGSLYGESANCPYGKKSIW